MSEPMETAEDAGAAQVEGRSDGKDLFGVLEQRTEALVDRQREALARIEDLRSQVIERDRTISELNGKIAAIQRMRNEVLQRVAALIERVDAVEQDLAQSDVAEAELTHPGGTA